MFQNSNNRPLSGTEPNDLQAIHMHYDGEFHVDAGGHVDALSDYAGHAKCPACHYLATVEYDTVHVPVDSDFFIHAAPIDEQMEYIEAGKILFDLRAVTV